MQKPVNKQTAILHILSLHRGKTMAVTVKGYLLKLVGCWDCGWNLTVVGLGKVVAPVFHWQNVMCQGVAACVLMTRMLGVHWSVAVVADRMVGCRTDSQWPPTYFILFDLVIWI